MRVDPISSPTTPLEPPAAAEPMAAPIVPPPSASGDPVTDALAAMAELGKNVRRLQRELRRSLAGEQYRAATRQARELRDKASAIRGAAWLSAASVALAGVAYGAQFGRGVSVTDPSRDPASVALGGAATVLLKASDLPTALGQAAATDHDAKAQGHAALAEHARVQRENAAEGARAAEQLIHRALEAIRAVADARNSALAAVTRG